MFCKLNTLLFLGSSETTLGQLHGVIFSQLG
jgi:hypothetical protein